MEGIARRSICSPKCRHARPQNRRAMHPHTLLFIHLDQQVERSSAARCLAKFKRRLFDLIWWLMRRSGSQGRDALYQLRAAQISHYVGGKFYEFGKGRGRIEIEPCGKSDEILQVHAFDNDRSRGLTRNPSLARRTDAFADNQDATIG